MMLSMALEAENEEEKHPTSLVSLPSHLASRGQACLQARGQGGLRIWFLQHRAGGGRAREALIMKKATCSQPVICCLI
jgi:hypothetical protein